MFLEGVPLEEGHVGQLVVAWATILGKRGRGKSASGGALAIPESRGADMAVDTKRGPCYFSKKNMQTQHLLWLRSCASWGRLSRLCNLFPRSARGSAQHFHRSVL